MKKALISPDETSDSGIRIAQIVEVDQIFEVALPLYWTDVPDDVKAETHYYDKIKSEPVRKPPPIMCLVGAQPDVTVGLPTANVIEF